jgi:hypothetical protein
MREIEKKRAQNRTDFQSHLYDVAGNSSVLHQPSLQASAVPFLLALVHVSVHLLLSDNR